MADIFSPPPQRNGLRIKHVVCFGLFNELSKYKIWVSEEYEGFNYLGKGVNGYLGAVGQ